MMWKRRLGAFRLVSSKWLQSGGGVWSEGLQEGCWTMNSPRAAAIASAVAIIAAVPARAARAVPVAHGVVERLLGE